MSLDRTEPRKLRRRSLMRAVLRWPSRRTALGRKTSHWAVARTVERFGSLDVAVVNAGDYQTAGTIHGFGPEEFDLLLDGSVRGVFLALQASAAEMQDGGRVIAIGSNTAWNRLPAAASMRLPNPPSLRS
jgi:NADP-dependent 3-hydroxy acid dehydrogenase YdfG